MTYTYPGSERTAGDTLDVVWSDGDKYPPDELLPEIESDAWPEQGALVLGEEGAMLYPHGGQPTLHPRATLGNFPAPGLPDRDHYHQWVNACQGRGRTHADFAYAGKLTEAILLGTVALRLPGQELAWDADALRVTNVAAANALLRRTYRAGWEVEGL